MFARIHIRTGRVLAGTIVLTMLALGMGACDRGTPTGPQQNKGSIGDGQFTGTGSPVKFKGHATALRASVLGSTVALCGAGPLPPEGGAEYASLLTANVGGVVWAQTAHAATVGMGDRCRSTATSADLHITAGGQRIVACFLMSRAQAVCVGGVVSVSGSSEVADLLVNGQRIAVTGQANQTVWLPLGVGRVVINEQVKAAGTITVRALRVVVAGSADIVVSETHAGVQCGDVTCDPSKDFVTGGGWITGTPSGAKGTFGVSGGIKNGSFWGHLTYVDHGAGGPKVKGTGVTAYTIVNTTTRRIEGTCEIDGRGGYRYVVDVADNGELGRSDMFRIQLSNGYYTSGSLQGGNIQLHRACQ